ncbi:hypothetical protein B296_00011225 [Ensete ventricosum]|uniref:Uncharacterized protein n=1 Tax=Ensete ventricosum TaxID=4639 RepID=A0A427A352_ENSVE|nr:hypothetical protein B296_00011225 [Ensete ventricosum]
MSDVIYDGSGLTSSPTFRGATGYFFFIRLLEPSGGSRNHTAIFSNQTARKRPEYVRGCMAYYFLLLAVPAAQRTRSRTVDFPKCPYSCAHPTRVGGRLGFEIFPLYSRAKNSERLNGPCHLPVTGIMCHGRVRSAMD